MLNIIFFSELRSINKNFLWQIIFIALLTSCNGYCPKIPDIKPPCCFDGRRPQVMVDWSDAVIDYQDCCDYECCDVQKNCDLEEKDLDPYLPHQTEYRFAVGDIMEISVFGDEETTVENVVVAPDGRVYYTFLNGIPAAGRTAEEIGNAIASKIGHLFINPIVTVVPKDTELRGYRILGRVLLPGLYPVIGTVRLRDAIGEAGGILTQNPTDNGSDISQRVPLANLDESFIVRENRRLNVDFRKLIYTADNHQNILIRPNDYIFIAPMEEQNVYILGAIRQPRRIQYTKNLTVMSAMASAAGWVSNSPYGPDTSRILVLRGKIECPCVICIDIRKILCGEARDFYLEPGDIVYVSNKTMRFGREMVRLALATVLQAFGTAAGSYYGTQWFIPQDNTQSSSSSTTSSQN
jgi:polysaccharide biosynthesis/export protein